MEELQLTLTPARVDQRNYGVQLSNWRVGQQLNALVVDTRPNGGLLLSVAGKTFTVSSDLPVQPGTRMALEVKQVGQDVVLQRVNDGAPPRADAGSRAAQTTMELSSARPSALLNQLSAQPARFGSPELQEIARELRGRALKAEGLTPGAIQRGLRDSGLFTEADLLAGRVGRARQSGKTSLSQLQTVALALADDLDDDVAEVRVLQQMVDRSAALLNGIAQQQLASLPQDDGLQRWVFTLPVQLNDSFNDVRVEFERPPRQVEQEDSWRASLTFDFPEMGSVTVRMQLKGSAVSVAFDCDNPATAARLNHNLVTLEGQLAARNLSAAGLAANATGTMDDPGAAPTGLSVEA